MSAWEKHLLQILEHLMCLIIANQASREATMCLRWFPNPCTYGFFRGPK